MAAQAEGRASHADALIQGVLVGEAVSNAGYIVLVADEHMRYLAASGAACELLGYSREEILGLTVPDLVVEANASELYDEFIRDHGQRGEITLRCKDGRSLEAHYDARQTEVGGLPYFVSVISTVESS
jgi:PAS domain S-box-containing protein